MLDPITAHKTNQRLTKPDGRLKDGDSPNTSADSTPELINDNNKYRGQREWSFIIISWRTVSDTPPETKHVFSRVHDTLTEAREHALSLSDRLGWAGKPTIKATRDTTDDESGHQHFKTKKVWSRGGRLLAYGIYRYAEKKTLNEYLHETKPIEMTTDFLSPREKLSVRKLLY